MKKFTIILAVAALLALVASSVSATGPSISIQNGDVISVTANENPQIVVQFGSQTGLDNVFIRCGVGEGLAVAGPAYTHGSFDRASIARDGSNVRFISNGHPSVGADFGAGQFRNVQFTVDILDGAEPGEEFHVTCRLLQLTEDPNDGFAQSTLDYARTTIVVR